MAKLLELSDDRSVVRILPEMGAAVADFVAFAANGDAAVLRPWPGPEAGLFGVGLNLLAPFSNRISGDGFHWDGSFRSVSPNLEGEACPIHGDAFQKPWDVLQHTRTSAKLVLRNGQIGPFRYSAECEYRLQKGALAVTLILTNEGETLPFGGGFHPWFPKLAGTTLQFDAETVWLEDSDHLPVREISVLESDWDFSKPRPLTDSWINNAFCGWPGKAKIDQPDLGICVSVTGGRILGTAIVYSPEAQAGFFCFEPVSHAVDALNMDGYPRLIPLARAETVTFDMNLGWSEREPTT